MIAEAYIAGQIGQAIYRVEDRYFVIDTDDAEEPRICRPRDFARMKESWAEIEVLSAPHLDVEQIRQELQSSRDAYHALSFSISGFDPALSDETRALCIDVANDLMQDEAVRAFVRNRLCARLLLDKADLTGGIALAEAGEAAVARVLYEEVETSQQAIQIVLAAWEAVAPDYFVSLEEQAEGERQLIERGVFADMVAALTAGNLSELDSIVMKYGSRRDFTQTVPRGILLINALKTHILEQRPSQLKRLPAQQVDQPFDPSFAEQPDAGGDPLRVLIFKIRNKQKKVRGKKRRGRALGADEAKARVDGQIEAIGQFIQQGDMARVNRRLRQLLEFQLEHSDRKHVAMTLCALAKFAIDAYAFDTAEQWVGYAFDLGVEDVVIERTQAMMLKEMGQLEEALALYEQIGEDFPPDAYTQTGRAEVLKDLGRVEEALALYEQTGRDFPPNVVVQNGRASLLIAMGRYVEARNLLSDTTPISHSDWIGYHILAMSYLKAGETDEAIRRLSYGMEHAPGQNRNYFASALGVAKMMDKRFAEAVEMSEPNVLHLHGVRRQAQMLFLGHAHAALKQEREARHSLAAAGEIKHPRLINLKSALTRRYGLSGEMDTPLSEVELALLDRQIEDSEFSFAMAA